MNIYVTDLVEFRPVSTNLLVYTISIKALELTTAAF